LPLQSDDFVYRFIWDVLDTQWEEGFSALEKFKEREGHCNVPVKHHEETYRLWQWVGMQRTNKDKMSNEHRQRLNDIGFIWNVNEAKWQDGFSALEKFKGREGHCNVPVKHREGTYRLGSWVNNQRTTKNTIMSNERRQRLDKIGFVWTKKL
jgi:Helicase associated domain